MLASPVKGYWLLLTCLKFDEALLQDAVTGNEIFTNKREVDFYHTIATDTLNLARLRHLTHPKDVYQRIMSLGCPIILQQIVILNAWIPNHSDQVKNTQVVVVGDDAQSTGQPHLVIIYRYRRRQVD